MTEKLDQPVVVEKTPSRGRGRFAWVCWIYLAFSIAMWLVFRLGGDKYWLPTVLLFGPRYVYALPLVILFPLALLFRRRAVLPLMITLIPLLTIMELSIPAVLVQAPFVGPRLRIFTCNIDGRHVSAPALSHIMSDSGADIIGLQELETDQPPAVTWPSGYHVIIAHDLALACRYPIREVSFLYDASLHGPGAVEQFEIQLPGGAVNYFNVHLATPREGLDPLMHDGVHGIGAMDHSIMSRWREADLTSHLIRSAHGPLLISGDFNTPSDSAIFRQYWSSYTDAFEQRGFGFGYSKYTRFWGIRIDHILAGDGWRFSVCHVGPDVGSDHLPVIADVQWSGDRAILTLPETRPSN